MFRISIALCVAALLAFAALAEERLALVIANSNYSSSVGKLSNPANDARLMADALRSLGFKVTTLSNLDEDDLEQAILDHQDRIERAGAGTVSFFYYSGHGAADSSRSENYLIPLKAEISRPRDLRVKAVGVNEVVESFAGAKYNFVIIDACRNFPFPYADTRTLYKGFVPEQEKRGTLIAFATSPGDVAADSGANGGPYARALAASLVRPGADYLDVFKDAQGAVYNETGGKQLPWIRDGLVGRFKFSAGSATSGGGLDAETSAFLAAQSCADYRSYQSRYPNGKFKTQIAAMLAAPPCKRIISAAEAEAATKAGWAAYLKKDYATAHLQYETACEGGRSGSCSTLGLLYQKGYGTPRDYVRAGAFYERGCDGGNAGGCHSLGYLYSEGLGVPRDYVRAKALYERACEAGDTIGCGRLAEYLYNGLGGSKDLARAATLFRKECSRWDDWSCKKLDEYGLSR